MTWVNGGHGLLTVSSLIAVGVTAKNGGSGDTFWYVTRRPGPSS
jgi:hypothetical protein